MRHFPKPGPFAAAVATPDEEAPKGCVLFGCGRPTMRFSGSGLSATYCKYHSQFANRHGSPWKRSYTALELRDYRRAAERYLNSKEKDRWVGVALSGLQGLLATSGPNERPGDTIHMRPRDKARAALARLRTQGVPAMRLLIDCAAVAMALAEDDAKPTDEGEFRNVQIAKLCLRKAGGYRYTRFGAAQPAPHVIPFGALKVNIGNGQLPAQKRWRIYTRSSGLVLRHLGQAVYEACEDAIGQHLGAMLEAKRRWYDMQNTGGR